MGIFILNILVDQRVIRFRIFYAPQGGLRDDVKGLFYDQLRAMTAMIPASSFLTPCSDYIDHGDSTGSDYKEVHGSCGYGKPDHDIECEIIPEYTLTFDLILCNVYLKKSNSHFITYKSGNTATIQIYVLSFQKSLFKLVTDVMVISGEESAPGKQHDD